MIVHSPAFEWKVQFAEALMKRVQEACGLKVSLADIEEVNALLAKTNIDSIVGKVDDGNRPGRRSGRVAMGRAIVRNPKAFIY